MKKYNLKYQIATGVLLLVVGTLVLLSDYIKEKRDVVFNDMNLAIAELNQDDLSNVEETTVEETVEVTNDNTYYEEYLGILEIKKINFYKGFYKKESSLNNVNYNLYVLPVSNYPDVDKGNLIIAGHSGNYSNSYFNTLYKLSIGDTLVVYYKDIKYTYQIVKIYNEKKTGSVRILKNKDETSLTLITCTKDDEEHQTIYIANLINKE